MGLIGAKSERYRHGPWRLVAILAASLVACATPFTAGDEEREGQSIPKPGRIAALRGQGPPSRILLISVAGLESSDFLLADGYVATDLDYVRMPNLARLAGEGVVGEHALPPSPGSRFASHASLVTGRLPSRHGIVADSQLEETGATAIPFLDSRQMKGTALWDAAIGRGVMALGWPTTIGARIESILPDTRPPDGHQTWLDLLRPISSPFLMRQLDVIAEDALSTAVVGLGSERRPESWPTAAEKDAALSEIACHVALSDRDPGLWLIRFNQTEVALLAAGTGSPGVAAALGRIDDEIGSIIDCLEETGQLANSAIFVVGDVAYRPVHTRVNPNIALVDKGLIGRDPRGSLGVRSWLAISRSHGQSAYVYAKDAESAVLARKILETEALRTGAFRVVSAAELADSDVDPQAWFGLEASSGFEIGNGLTKPILRPATVRASAGLRRVEGEIANSVGFVAWGRGIRRNVRISELDLVDIAPTISMLFGLRLDEPIDGEPIVGILRAAIPPPPIGPKRIGIGNDRDIDRTLRDLGGGR